MTDIVDELKSAAIEELKYELDSKWWIDRNSEPVLFEMRSYRAAATITTLRAEVEKLRAALDLVAKGKGDPVAVACAALGEEKKG